MRLRPFGIGHNAAVLVFSAQDGAPAPQAEAELDRFLADAGIGALVATRDRLLCAVVDARDDLDPVALAARARDAISGESGSLRAAASRAAPVGSLRRTFHEGRCALEAAALANGSSPAVASYRVRTSCCSHSRTTTRCGSTATACSARWRTRAASTATS